MSRSRRQATVRSKARLPTFSIRVGTRERGWRFCPPTALVVFLGLAVAACGPGEKTPATVSVEPAAVQRPAPATAREPECEQCRIEDRRQAAHRQQVTWTARYLRLADRRLDGRRTRQRCTMNAEVVGTARFELLGEASSPQRRAALIDLALPCPELARPDYAKLYHYDPDDSERDGLGHAPILRPGVRYRLTLVRDAEPPTLVAVNPL